MGNPDGAAGSPAAPGLTADIEALIKVWRAHIAKSEPASEFSRAAGFNSAIALCADQLQGALRSNRD